MLSLVVEDDAISRRFLQSMLEQHGAVECVENGDDAVRVFSEAFDSGHPFDLVCLDIMMPGMDGHEVLVELRKYERSKGVAIGDGVKVIITSALGDSENVLRAYMGRCGAYCVKPIDPNDFCEHLQKLGLIDI